MQLVASRTGKGVQFDTSADVFGVDCSRPDQHAIPTQPSVMRKSALKQAFNSTSVLSICSLSRVAHPYSGGKFDSNIAGARCASLTRIAVHNFD